MITRGFFEQRQQKLDEHHAKGYLLLEEVLQQNNISVQQLINAGLLRLKEIVSTAELYDYETTKKGRRYFKELKRMQLIMISEKKLVELMTLEIGLIK